MGRIMDLCWGWHFSNDLIRSLNAHNDIYIDREIPSYCRSFQENEAPQQTKYLYRNVCYMDGGHWHRRNSRLVNLKKHAKDDH